MLLTPYYSENENIVTVSAEQASQFAKLECRDFNPLHDPDSRRFCVPGDLLFSLALLKYGISESMRFEFTGMVGDGVGLLFPQTKGEQIIITNNQGKSLLELNQQGNSSNDRSLIESLITNYIIFSGENFPMLLMPLMQKHQVMFNPARPLVMYNSMSFDLQRLQVKEKLQVKLNDVVLQVEQKRAEEFLYFDIFDGESQIGQGVKKVVIGGIKPYDYQAMSAFSEAYEACRSNF